MALPAEKLEAQETIVYSSHESSDSATAEATANNQQESSDNTGTFLPPIKQVSEYVQLAKAGGHKGEYTVYCERQLVRNNKLILTMRYIS